MSGLYVKWTCNHSHLHDSSFWYQMQHPVYKASCASFVGWLCRALESFLCSLPFLTEVFARVDAMNSSLPATLTHPTTPTQNQLKTN
eukprot:2870279-Amphidinium_carterae.1